MARQVKQENGYMSVLLKLIPTEMVAAYIFILNVVSTSDRKYGMLVVVVMLLVFTPFFLKKVHKVKSVSQIVISTLSFAIWTYAVGSPFAEWGLHVPWIASAVLFVWTTLVPKMFKFVPLGNNADFNHFVGRG